MKTLLSLAATAITGLAIGCGDDDGSNGSDSAVPKPTTVTIKTFMFEPDPITVDAGETVTWRNEDQTKHTVTSGPRNRPDGMHDKTLGTDATFSHRFTKPGTYRYFCDLHSGPGMQAKVIVQ